MRTLKLFILVSMMLFASISYACGPYYYSAVDCRIYRILPPLWQASSYVMDDFETKNIITWSKQTGCKDTAAIRQAIYQGTLSDWEKAYENKVHKTGRSCDENIKYSEWVYTNQFFNTLGCASGLRKKNVDSDAIRVLYWSKLYESIRKAQRSPWYYNCRLDTDEMNQLHQLFKEVMAFKPQKYADRFEFLAIKCAWALGEDSIVLDIWEKSRLKKEGSLFYNEAMDYAARSLARMGRQKEANAIYAKIGNYTQLIPRGASLPTQLRIMLKVCPNSTDIVPMLQDYLTKLDVEQAATYFWPDERDWFFTDSMLVVAREAIDNPKVCRKAMWRYAAACILDYNGKTEEALAMLQGAEKGDGDAFLQKSVRTLTFYLRTRTESPTEDFLKYAIKEVKWLDKEMVREWNTLSDTAMREDIRNNANYRWSEARNDIYSYAALRRILLEDSVGLAWRMADCGLGVRALQMANMAENHICDLTSNPYIKGMRTSADGIYGVYYRDTDDELRLVWIFSPADTAKFKDKEFMIWQYTENQHDYSNGMFCLADRMDAGTLEQYRQRIVRPRDNDDRWFNARSYTDMNYWQDIVGTHCLRERNYRAAARHFQCISPSYQRMMNIECGLDPFGIDRIASHDTTRYKYHFAHRMDSLGHVILHETDPDRRGLAMLEYSIGLENSFGMCWWLTSYEKGWTGPDLTDIEDTEYAKKANAVAAQLRKKSLQTIRSKDAFARYYLRLGKYGIVRKRYADTYTGQHLALVCDDWGLYRQRTDRSSHRYGPFLDKEPYKKYNSFVTIY